MACSKTLDYNANLGIIRRVGKPQDVFVCLQIFLEYFGELLPLRLRSVSMVSEKSLRFSDAPNAQKRVISSHVLSESTVTAGLSVRAIT